MERMWMLLECGLMALAATLVLATVPAVAHADTVSVGTTRGLTPGHILIIVGCAIVAVAVGIYLLVRIRRQRRRGADLDAAKGDQDRQQ